MDLERLSVRLRPRIGWESADLGFALARTWRRPIYRAWLTVAAPLAILLVLWLGGTGLLVFWWLLPLGESVVLFTLSRAVFGSVPAWKQTLRAAPGLWRQAAGELLLRRLIPNRVLLLPLAQLEGLRGKARRQRASVLNAGRDVTSLLAIAFVFFEAGLWIAVIGLAVLLTPSWLGIDWVRIAEGFFTGSLPRGASSAVWLLAAGIVLALHPLYVSAGFALYLNRRTDLEGWDLEIAFRRLARRIEKLGLSAEAREASPPDEAPAPSSVSPALVIGLVVSIAALSVAEPARASGDPSSTPAVQSETDPAEATQAVAESADWPGPPERDPRRLIREIMERPELQREQKVVRWRLRDDLLDDLPAGSDSSSSSRPNVALVWIVRTLAAVGEPLLWLVAATAILLLLRAAWRRLPEGPEPDQGRDRLPPEQLFGLDLRPETLPADVPGEAEALWGAGRPAAALSLLYRGALGRLVAGGLELRESFTEDDCLRASVSKLESRRFEFFSELTRAWQRVAYAHRVPEESSARRLWSSWGEHFGSSEASRGSS